MKKIIPLLLFTMISSVESRENPSDCEYVEERSYNPYQRYYPYCRIYQDSRVISNTENDDYESYWPARRDDDLIDALTR